jgi:hypothetical protein
VAAAAMILALTLLYLHARTQRTETPVEND